MLLKELFEARKNPNQNPKISINQAIAQAATTKETIADTVNAFISFTSIDKLGINPKSIYDTPLGIYAYPIAYAAKVVGATSSATTLPFAGESEFANIFNTQGNIINIATIDAATVNQYCQRIGDYVKKVDPNLFDQLKTAIVDAKTKAHVNSTGGQFWYVTRAMAEAIARVTNSKPTVVWNKLFRMIGIAGVVDIRGTTGMKIIHEKEPCQAVFFSTQALVNIKRVYNKYAPSEQEASRERGAVTSKEVVAASRELEQATTYDQVVAILGKYGHQMVRLVRDSKLREQFIRDNPEAIAFIPKPTDREQFISLSNDFDHSLKTIKNINDKVLADVISKDPSEERIKAVLKWRKQLSEPIQVALVQADPRLIKNLQGLSKAAVQAAIDNWKPTSNVPSFMKAAASKVPQWLINIANRFGISTNK